jgi:hypothetical protein
VLADLLGVGKTVGVSLWEREIRYRLEGARAYETEAEIGSAAADFGSWRSLCDAGFPPVEVPGDGEPYDPHAAGRKPPGPALSKLGRSPSDQRKTCGLSQEKSFTRLPVSHLGQGAFRCLTWDRVQRPGFRASYRLTRSLVT